jgi:hypothetical protein
LGAHVSQTHKNKIINKGNNKMYFEGCADEYMLIYTIKASVHFEIVLMICFVLSLVESTPSIITAADVETAQNTNLLHSREEVCSASTVDTGIDKQFVVPYTLPKPVPSIHATLGAHV